MIWFFKFNVSSGNFAEIIRENYQLGAVQSICEADTQNPLVMIKEPCSIIQGHLLSFCGWGCNSDLPIQQVGKITKNWIPFFYHLKKV